MASDDLRERILKALRESPNAAWLVLPGPVDIAPTFADAVLAVVQPELDAAEEGAFENLRLEWKKDRDALLARLARMTEERDDVRAACSLAMAALNDAMAGIAAAVGLPDEEDADLLFDMLGALGRRVEAAEERADAAEALVQSVTSPNWRATNASLNERAQQAEAALARVEALAIRWDHAEHPYGDFFAGHVFEALRTPDGGSDA